MTMLLTVFMSFSDVVIKYSDPSNLKEKGFNTVAHGSRYSPQCCGVQQQELEAADHITSEVRREP